MDEKTPEEKRKSEEPEFTLEPVQEESKTEEPEFTLEPSPDQPEENTGLTLDTPEEEPQQEKPSFTLEPSETKTQPEEPKAEEPEFTLEPSPDQPEEPQLDLEPPKKEAPPEEPQLDLEPPKEETKPEEPQLDLEPPKEKDQPKTEQTEQKPIEELVVDTEVEPSPPEKDDSHGDQKGTKYEKGVSRRFDPRRTKVREDGEEKFEPQISFAKGTAQDGPSPIASAAALKNPKIIVPAAIALIIIAAVLIFMLKPESTPVEPKKKLPKKIAVKKKPAQEKKAVMVKEKKEAAQPAMQYKKYSNNIFSVKLPEGCKTATDPNTNVNKIFFLYGKNIKVQIIYWKQNREWNPEEMMYNKIEEIQKEKTSSNALRVNNYGLINISGCRGYEIVMNGIRNYTYSRAKFYSLYGKGKIFLIDIDCKNSKDPDVLKIFNAVNDSIAKTLKVK